jgi:hypothetical protein
LLGRHRGEGGVERTDHTERRHVLFHCPLQGPAGGFVLSLRKVRATDLIEQVRAAIINRRRRLERLDGAGVISRRREDDAGLEVPLPLETGRRRETGAMLALERSGVEQIAGGSNEDDLRCDGARDLDHARDVEAVVLDDALA